MVEIRHPKSLLEKLGVKPGAVAVALGVRDAQFRDDLARHRVKVYSRLPARSSLIFLGVSSKYDLARLRNLSRRIRPDGAVWVVAPRGSAAVREADVLAAGVVDRNHQAAVKNVAGTSVFVLSRGPARVHAALDAGPRSLL